MPFAPDTATFSRISAFAKSRARAAGAGIFDAILFGSFWIAAAASALSLAGMRVLALPVQPALLALIFCGTLSLYNLDRLLDLARDAQSSPERSAFVRKNFALLSVLAGGAGLTAALLAFDFGNEVLTLCVSLFGLSLLHPRLKKNRCLKSAYLAGAWWLVVALLPVLAQRSVTASFDAASILAAEVWSAAILIPTLFANALVSGGSESTTQALRGNAPHVPALGLAKIITLLGVILASLAPLPVRALIAIPLATLLALLEFRPTERYRLFVLDGALLAGAGLVAWFLN